MLGDLTRWRTEDLRGLFRADLNDGGGDTWPNRRKKEGKDRDKDYQLDGFAALGGATRLASGSLASGPISLRSLRARALLGGLGCGGATRLAWHVTASGPIEDNHEDIDNNDNDYLKK